MLSFKKSGFILSGLRTHLYEGLFWFDSKIKAIIWYAKKAGNGSMPEITKTWQT